MNYFLGVITTLLVEFILVFWFICIDKKRDRECENYQKKLKVNVKI